MEDVRLDAARNELRPKGWDQAETALGSGTPTTDLSALALLPAIAIDGVGPIIGEAVERYFSDPANLELVGRLEAAGLTMTQPEAPKGNLQLKRLLHMAMGIAIAVAFTGYFLGLQQTSVSADLDRNRTISPPTASAGKVSNVIDYVDRPAARFSPNADWHNHLKNLRFTEPNLLTSPPLSDAQKAGTLIRRASRRAFDGAPATIPHAIHQTNPAVCMACHEHGRMVDGLVATPMPHRFYANCTQCHVESDSRQFRLDAQVFLTESEFAGRPSPEQGERYWGHAPPVIPHPVWMRENCLSCHGTLGASGIQSSHPWRHSCTQCHAPAADQDQRDFSNTLQQGDVFFSQ